MSYIFPQKVLFKHCDPAGIVFFPRYFEMINDCVETFFDTELGFSFEDIHGYGGVPTAEISARFLAPSRHGDRLELRLKILKIGIASLELEIAAVCSTQNRFIAKSALVFVNLDGRPNPWPTELRENLKNKLRNNNDDK